MMRVKVKSKVMSRVLDLPSLVSTLGLLVLLRALPAPAGESLPNGDVAPAPAMRNAIIISLDSVRADHLPLYGYPRMTTPFLSELAARPDVHVFENLTAVASSCHPAHTTILSGLYPQQVGVPYCGEDLIMRDAAFTEEDVADLEAYQSRLKRTPDPLRRKKISAVINWLEIPAGTQTLATFLQDQGYQTGGFVSIWTLRGRYGYDRGFDRFVDEMPHYYGPRSLGWMLRTVFHSQFRQHARETMDEVLQYLGSLSSDRPFFIFANLADTHVPYRDPGDIRFSGESDAARRELEAAWRERYPLQTRERAMRQMTDGKQFLLDAYDRSIRHTDGQIERLFRLLQNRGQLEHTLVVILGDHGDSFGQHFYQPAEVKTGLFFEHTVSVWQETQHVPLIVFDPLRRECPSRLDANVSQVDIVPTVLSALGFPEDSYGMGRLPGRDLFGDLDADRSVFFLTFGRGRPGLLQDFSLDFPTYIGFRRGATKFFVNRRKFKNPNRGRSYLYDLRRDPHEMSNLAEDAKNADLLDRYRAELVTWYSASVADRGMIEPHRGRQPNESRQGPTQRPHSSSR